MQVRKPLLLWRWDQCHKSLLWTFDFGAFSRRSEGRWRILFPPTFINTTRKQLEKEAAGLWKANAGTTFNHAASQVMCARIVLSRISSTSGDCLPIDGGLVKIQYFLSFESMICLGCRARRHAGQAVPCRLIGSGVRVDKGQISQGSKKHETKLVGSRCSFELRYNRSH